LLGTVSGEKEPATRAGLRSARLQE